MLILELVFVKNNSIAILKIVFMRKGLVNISEVNGPTEVPATVPMGHKGAKDYHNSVELTEINITRFN